MTSLGLNNYGKQVYRYGLEDTDVDEKGEEIFRESDSTFFCRVRDLFSAELKTLYNTLESKNAWHAESFLNKCDEWQNEFPEELWRIDVERKYLRTYNSSFINGKGDAQFLENMANGKMKYHRRQWERSQEKYMASKYQSSAASSDNSVFRCSVPNGDLAVVPNYRLKLTPYAYMYLNVKYGTQNPIQLRAEPNIEYEIPFEGDKADIVDVYSSSLIQDFGDLSTCYVATADTSKAEKVKRLIFGNDTEGYDNPNFTSLTTGANHLLEELNIENVSGLTQALDLSALANLREVYAHGSGIGGVAFASGGSIEIAELPAISSLTMKNLVYLTNLDITDLSKLTTLTVESCNSINLLEMLDAAPNLNRIRLTGVDWVLTDTSMLERLYGMAGIDKNGYNVEKSVLSGKIHVAEIKQQKMYDYLEAWPDLEISYDSMVEQFVVTFVNDDGTELEVQYVDIGMDAEDPTSRTENPLIPAKESSISHRYTFAGWDSPLTEVFGDRTIRATYTAELREYTIRYVNPLNKEVLQESTDKYGAFVPYEGGTPVYTAGEDAAYTYHLFERWDKSGYIDGDKTVNAVFDKFIYSASAFDDKKLKDMRPVELYALTKLRQKFGIVDGVDKGEEFVQSVVSDGDKYQFTMGYDVDYDDIPSQTIVENATGFDGTSTVFDGSRRGWDTKIKLFEKDEDFVLAIDYTFDAANPNGNVLAQCYQTNGSIGFKLSSSGTSSAMAWSISSNTLASLGGREIVVLRHVAGDNYITVYNSALSGDNVVTFPLEGTERKLCDATLMFGAAKADDGVYSGFATGCVHWCKLWKRDLGDDVCRALVLWPHEVIKLAACGTRRYALSANPAQKCTLTFLADQLLDRMMAWNTGSGNIGGWANSTMNARLNGRFYQALPLQIKMLIKQVQVKSTTGNLSSDVIVSDSYITVPAILELMTASAMSSRYDAAYANEIDAETKTISYMNGNAARIRTTQNGGAIDYWTRSPYIGSSGAYVWRIDADGKNQTFEPTSTQRGVLVMMSI